MKKILALLLVVAPLSSMACMAEQEGQLFVTKVKEVTKITSDQCLVKIGATAEAKYSPNPNCALDFQEILSKGFVVTGPAEDPACGYPVDQEVSGVIVKSDLGDLFLNGQGR